MGRYFQTRMVITAGASSITTQTRWLNLSLAELCASGLSSFQTLQRVKQKASKIKMAISIARRSRKALVSGGMWPIISWFVRASPWRSTDAINFLLCPGSFGSLSFRPIATSSSSG